MFGNSSLGSLFLLSVLILISSAHPSQDQDPNGPQRAEVQRDHSSPRCHSDADCGDGAHCNNEACQCSDDKSYVIVPEGKPMCQKEAKIGEACKYDLQCTHNAGDLSRCNKDKCECFDTKNKGRDTVREWNHFCYRLTTINNGTCYRNEECQASIKPEAKVSCKAVHDSNKGKGVCVCESGAKCEDKPLPPGNSGTQVTSFSTFAIIGVLATKVIL